MSEPYLGEKQYDINMTKRLVSDSLIAFIKNSQSVAKIKQNFFAVINDKGCSFNQLFQRLDTARKGYLTHQDFLKFFR